MRDRLARIARACTVPHYWRLTDQFALTLLSVQAGWYLATNQRGWAAYQLTIVVVVGAWVLWGWMNDLRRASDEAYRRGFNEAASMVECALRRRTRQIGGDDA